VLNANNAKLAVTYVRLNQFREAVDAARKANSTKTWKEVNAACVQAGEFRLASMCGLNIIVHPEHLDDLMTEYERLGHSEELMKLMEQGLGLERAHQGIFTDLGVLYAKYKREKLMEHVKIFWSRINIPKLIRECERSHLWEAVCFLHCQHEEFDSAANTMMEHSGTAYSHDKFMEVMQKVSNRELFYRAAEFYLAEHPLQLSKLLIMLSPRLDHARVVEMLRKDDHLAVAMEYLRDVQKDNLAPVNEAVNEVLLEEEDFDALRDSITEHDNFDQIELAQKIEKSELLEFRRISALLYKQNKRWKQSVELSKQDKVYKDAIDTASASADPELVRELLDFFLTSADGGADGECFAATLFTCYDLVDADVVMELAWRNKLTDFAMPYMIQHTRDLNARVCALESKLTTADSDEKGQGEAQQGESNGVMQIAATAYNDMQQPSYNGVPDATGFAPQPGMPQQQQMYNPGFGYTQ